MPADSDQDLLAPYRIEAPLTDPEVQFVAHLRGEAEGQSLLAALKDLGISITAGSESAKPCLEVGAGQAEPHALEAFCHERLSPRAERLWHAGARELSLGGFSLGLRSGLAVLGQGHATTLSAINDVAFGIEGLGHAAEDLQPGHTSSGVSRSSALPLITAIEFF